MFRLVLTVRRGSSSTLPGSWERFPTIERAREAAAQLLRHERVARIAIVRSDVPPSFIEWMER